MAEPQPVKQPESSTPTGPQPVPPDDGKKTPSDATKTLAQIARWWRWRGGWKDFFTSPYMLGALALMVPTYHLWLTDSWWELPLSILPNLVGFSLGGYAILLAFGDEKFRAILMRPARNTTEPDPPSRYMRVSAIFLHFILVQIWALACGVLGRATNFSIEVAPGGLASDAIDVGRVVFGFLGFFAFLYAVSLAAAAAMSVFGLSEGFETYVKLTDNSKKK